MDDITGLILAGGAGRRMGGADKGLVEYRGRPLVAHAIERLVPQVATLMISANRNRETYAALGHPVIADTEADYPGPLAGLAAGLAACTTSWLLCVPCDCPGFPDDLSRRLLDAANRAGRRLAVARCDTGLQPTFELCHRDLLPALQSALAAGKRKASLWCDEQGAVEVVFPDANAFINLNNLENLSAPG